MGSCFSNPSARSRSEADLVAHRKANAILKQEERRQKKVIKILLLGPGGSGKSTVLKQMRLLCGLDFQPEEISHFGQLVHANLLEGLHLLLDLADELGIPLDSDALPHAKVISDRWNQASYQNEAKSQPSAEVKRAAQLLWATPAIQQCWRRGNETAMPENMQYLMRRENFDRFFEPGFTPTDVDILHTRAKTTGILETFLPVGERVYNLVDVGGQRSERKKWLNCFVDVNAMLFVVNLNGYDECLIEDRDSNQMQESLLLFDQLLSNRLFRSTSMILFMNKHDLFIQKLPNSPLRGSYRYPDFPTTGDGKDPALAADYLRAKFLRLGRKYRPRQEGANAGIYSHYTSAVDKDGMRVVMLAVTDLLLREAIKESLLI